LTEMLTMDSELAPACNCGGVRCSLRQDDRRHGSPTGYGNNRCRCLDCVNAWSAYSVTARHARRLRGLEPNDPRHGTDNGYTNYNCRCEACKEARAETRRAA
jgi:hypothetical protein